MQVQNYLLEARTSFQDAIDKANVEISRAQTVRDDTTRELQQLQAEAGETRIRLRERVQAFDKGLLSREQRDCAQTAYDAVDVSIRMVRNELEMAENQILAAEAQREIAQAELASVRALPFN